MKQYRTALVWFTNNLRTRDNVSLSQATKNAEQVIGIYCFQKDTYHRLQYGFKKMGTYRASFLRESVIDLKVKLQSHSIPLYIHVGDPKDCIAQVCIEHNVEALYFQHECTSEEEDKINRVREDLPHSVDIHQQYDQFLYHPDEVYDKLNTIPDVFTDFRKNVEKLCIVREEATLEMLPQDNWFETNTHVPSLEELGYTTYVGHPDSAFPFSGGESSAEKRIDHYFYTTRKLSEYKQTRNGMIGLDYSSKLSPWLANGSISARSIFWEVKEYEKIHGSNTSTYWLIFELLWRDYFKFIALKYKKAIFDLGGIRARTYTWNKDKERLSEWVNGETTEPFVNANMIELKKTGWMSNRGRQNVASYFAKELKLDWRIGAAYFESMLIDYDVHSNYGNWMYLAGVGNDLRDRKFDVRLQAKRYDTDNSYQKQWLL